MISLSVEHLILRNGTDILLDDLSFDLKPGRILAVMGENGVGKSSLADALCGARSIESGRIRYSDHNISDMSVKHRSETISWMGEMPQTQFGLQVLERLELAAGKPLDETDTHLLEASEVDLLFHKALSELSSGELQRVELAAAVLHPGEAWLFDEPMNHLDYRHQCHWLALIKSRVSAENKVAVLVLHDLLHMQAVADSLLLLNRGSWRLFQDIKDVDTDIMKHCFRTEFGELNIQHPLAHQLMRQS